jgi:hypothetical protein
MKNDTFIISIPVQGFGPKTLEPECNERAMPMYREVKESLKQ